MADTTDPAGESAEAGRAPEVPSLEATAPESVIRILLEVTTALTSTLNLDDVLGEMLSRTIHLASSTAGTIILMDGTGRATRLIASRRGQPYEVAEQVLDTVLTRGLAGWVAEHRCIARVDDVRTDERWVHIPDTRYQPLSAVSLPVIRHGAVLGVISLTHVDARHFDEATVELLSAIAGQAAIAIENAQLFSEVQRLATTDPLTGLFTRRRFFELARAALAGGARPLAAVLVDVDRFKAVNDTWGHATGDEVLAEVGRRLGAAAEAERAVLGRYGGEEFALILPGRDLSGARVVAEALREAVGGSEIVAAGGALRVTISLGVAEAARGEAELDALLREADRRLYEAKAAGRDCVR
jgi:diguanylate cyclase (GGDEF)-like protein